MKRLLILLTTMLLLMLSLSATASASDFDAVAEDLSAIGMFRGTAGGFELDRAPRRSEAAIMLVRLYGAEDVAKAAYEAGEITHPFTDVSPTASPAVAWLYTNGITNGLTETTFGSGNPCSAKMYTVFLLRALGYQDNVDFFYADALTFAQEKGFYDPVMFAGDFLRDDLAALTYQALAADLADGSTYLLDSLIQSGAIEKTAAAPMTQTIEAYRAMQAATGSNENQSMDMDINMVVDVKISCPALELFEKQSAVSTGNMKMILDENRSVQMVNTLETTVDGISTRSDEWIKDGWVYQATELNGKPVKVRQSVSDELAAAENMATVQPSAMNVSGLAMIESVDVTKSGPNTVYTMVIRENLGGTMAGLEDIIGETAGNITFGTIEATYTIGPKGDLKKISTIYSMATESEISIDAAGSNVTMCMVYDYDTTMKINATGKSVKIHFPDFSDFIEIPASSENTEGMQEAHSYKDVPLIVEQDPMSYKERLAWVKSTEYNYDNRGFQIVPGAYTEGESCLAYTSEMWGTPHAEQNALTIRFADGTLARLPLPGVNYNFGAAAPDNMVFQEDYFVYTVSFAESDIVDEEIIHAAGTYYYIVDLTAKTVSLYLF